MARLSLQTKKQRSFRAIKHQGPIRQHTHGTNRADDAQDP